MKTYNLYINSINRDFTEESHDFNLYLNNQIIVEKNQYLNVDVCSFYMVNSMYNISNTLKNNTFDIEVRNLSTNALISTIFITIPDGNYSVLTLRDYLNTVMTNVISISYNYAQNSYTYKKTDNNFKYILKNIKCKKQLGLYNNNVEVTSSGITGKSINMVEFQQIMVKTDLKHEALNQDNITDGYNDLNVSEILFWCNKQDVEPFRAISYQNEDGGDSFSYNITDTNIQKINLKLFNEKNQMITDAPEYFIHLKFTVGERYENTFYEIGGKVLKLLNDIHYVLLNILFRKILSL